MHGEVESLLQTVLRPLIEADGGRIELIAVRENTVVLALRGACVGCPGLHYTRRHVLEPAVRAVAGDVRVEVHASAQGAPAAGP